MFKKRKQRKLRKQWVQALRSNTYKQGRNQLRSSSGQEFCCLGVLCDIYDPTRWGKEYMMGNNTWYFGGPSNKGLPPADVFEAVGMSRDFAIELAIANDGSNISDMGFTKIASMIEKKFNVK